jgi:hypothetical protein
MPDRDIEMGTVDRVPEVRDNSTLEESIQGTEDTKVDADEENI